MIKELHGKCYYIEMTENRELLYDVMNFITEQKALKDEKFYYTQHPNRHWIILSDSKLETFRGEKYSAWERVKRYVYKLKKEAAK